MSNPALSAKKKSNKWPLYAVFAATAVILLAAGHHNRDTIREALTKGPSGLLASTGKGTGGKGKNSGPIVFDKVVCFGDSLSDDGTGAWKVTNHTWPTNPAYVGHRFTNGPVYTEYLAQDLRLPLISYATGGASVSKRRSSKTGAKSDWPVDCILEQIDQYSVNKTDESNTVFVIYAGANDAFFAVEEGGEPSEVMEDITFALARLRKIGAKHMIFPTLPPLGINYPYANSQPHAAPLMGIFSNDLRQMMLEWAKKEAGVVIADFYTLYASIMSNPERYEFGRDKLKVGCIGERCVHDKEYIWFDDYHPTTRVHRMLADVSMKALASIPGTALHAESKAKAAAEKAAKATTERLRWR